jgi:tetratricopeptide (TPR) repeat protein
MSRKVLFPLVAIIGLFILTMASAGCKARDWLEARDHLNKGVQAFKSAKYSEAVEHFKTAVDLDSKNPTARLYLATAYMSQYIPGAGSPENEQMAKAAHDQFLEVLKQDPKNVVAITSIASLYYQEASGIQGDARTKKLDQAREWYEKLVAADPNNKDAYYTLGVIDWAKWYPAFGAARAELGMKPEEPGPLKDKKLRDKMRAEYLPIIDDGIGNLSKALEKDPEYDDAMAYLNLLHREKADLAESQAEHTKEIAEADMWLQKALDTKKMKAAKVPATGGVQAEGK